MEDLERDDLAMMKAPDRWPLSFWLPLKQRQPDDGWPKLGWLEQFSMATIGLKPPEPVVHLGNINKKGEEGIKVYESLEAVVADGWVVD